MRPGASEQGRDMNDHDTQHGSAGVRTYAVPHEELVEAALEDAAPSRGAVWAWFATGAMAVEKADGPAGIRSAAGLADAMLAEYDRRFP
jgi:hypothetical protein